jgi:hypothetical protein
MLALLCFRTLHSCAFSMRRWLKISLFDPYRPELHYMRGPGPKWREKHARSAKHVSVTCVCERLGTANVGSNERKLRSRMQ